MNSKRNAPLVVLSLFCLTQSIAPANAQRSFQQMEQMLNQIDSTPPAQMQRASRPQTTGYGQTQATRGFQNFQPVQQPVSGNPFGGIMKMFAGGQPQQAQVANQSKTKGFNPLRELFGDGSGANGTGGNGAGSNAGNASRARTQASVAHNAYLRSCYGDHDSRSSAADEAYYAAEEARHEAGNAEAKAQSGGGNAWGYAESARAAADDAQADADRARSNADNY